MFSALFCYDDASVTATALLSLWLVGSMYVGKGREFRRGEQQAVGTRGRHVRSEHAPDSTQSLCYYSILGIILEETFYYYYYAGFYERGVGHSCFIGVLL